MPSLALHTPGDSGGAAADPPVVTPKATYMKRVFLVLAFVLWTKGNKEAYATKRAALEAVWVEELVGPIPGNWTRHMREWYDRFYATGSVLRAVADPRHVLPDEVARRAADLVKAGYFVPATYDGQPAGQMHMWFRTIADAIQRVPELAQIVLEYGIDAKHLLRRMHDVDPKLKWRPIDGKGLLTAEQMAKRRTCAQWFLQQMHETPHFLDGVVWIDQVKLWLFGGVAGAVHVWKDVGKQGWNMVVPSCGSVSAKAMHVCMYVAVHAKLGLVYFQYVKGTVGGWKRKMWRGTPGQERTIDPDFRVSGEHGTAGPLI